MVEEERIFGLQYTSLIGSREENEEETYEKQQETEDEKETKEKQETWNRKESTALPSLSQVGGKGRGGKRNNPHCRILPHLAYRLGEEKKEEEEGIMKGGSPRRRGRGGAKESATSFTLSSIYSRRERKKK